MKRLLLFVLVFLSACGPMQRSRTAATLNDVETYIDAHPDSALAVLRALPPRSLRGPAQRARAALLHSMALDKCYIDLQTDSILAPAVVWYGRHGSPDEKLKTWYYQGRILQNKGDLGAAAVAYTQAESFAADAEDAHAKALLYLTFASIYNAVCNIQKEQEYTERGLETLSETGDPLYDSAQGQLAIVYHNQHKWDMADSLYRKGMASASNNPHVMIPLLSNYARSKLVRPDKDPKGAVELLDRKRNDYGSALTISEAGVYAYAKELLGKRKEADGLIQQLDRMAQDNPVWLINKSRIEEHRGEYQQAYQHANQAHIAERKDIDAILSESVTQSIRNQMESSLEQARQQMKTKGAVSILVITLLVVALLLLLYIHQKQEMEADRLLSIRDAVIKEQETALTHAEQKESDHIQELESMSASLAAVRTVYMKERLSRLQQIGWIKNVLWENTEERLSDQNALRKLREDISYIHELDGNGVVLVRRVDKALGGLITSLRKDLRLRGKPKDVLFLCGCLLKLSPGLLAEILKTSTSNVYVKKHRMRKRIESLAKQDYSVILESLK